MLKSLGQCGKKSFEAVGSEKEYSHSVQNTNERVRGTGEGGKGEDLTYFKQSSKGQARLFSREIGRKCHS